MKIFKISTWIFSLVLVGGIFLLIRLVTPSYPSINNNASTNEVKQFIGKILENEARNISFQYIDSPSHGAPVEYIKASEAFINNLVKCKKDKECLIYTYNEFMGEWSSDVLRRQTRAYYMLEKFGVIGEQINQSLGFMY